MVRDDGSKDASILLIGEAPGRTETSVGRPFVGPSGELLKKWWREAGLKRDDFYITNVLNVMPKAKNGNIDEAIRTGTLSRGVVEDGMSRIGFLATQMPNLRMIVPCGNYAAYAVTPYGRTAWDTKKPGITSIRGSIYGFKDNTGRTIKTIPTLHPAAVLRQEAWAPRSRKDWKRIADELSDSRLLLPQRMHHIHPTFATLSDFLDVLDAKKHVLSIDIETWGNSLKCVGFAIDKNHSLVVPTQWSYWKRVGAGDEDRVMARVMKFVKDICEHSVDKVMQNGLFDTWWLAQYGIHVKNYFWDTLGMHHALDPEESHSLDFLASIFTRQPYWKDEGKDGVETSKIAESQGMDRLYTYNGLDVTVTLEIFEVLYDLLRDEGMIDFYLNHYADMNQPLLSPMLGGVRMDTEEAVHTRERLQLESIEARDAAGRLPGVNEPLFNVTTKLQQAIFDVYHNWEITTLEDMQEFLVGQYKPYAIEAKWIDMQAKGISDAKLATALHDRLGVPRRKVTATGRPKMDEIVLRETIDYAKGRKVIDEEKRQSIIQVCQYTMESRHKRKLASYVDPTKVDGDGRLRCSYKYTTKTGRLASSSNPCGTGMNLQNIDRGLRHLFLPNEGHVLIEVDLSQAEARVVNCMTGDDDMIRLARRLPADGDTHVENAVIIFSQVLDRQLTPDEITYEQRYLGKRGVHAAGYGMRGKTLSEQLLKDGYGFSPHACQVMIDAYMTEREPIRRYQSEVRQILLKEKRLFTSWGRKISFEHRRMDDELYRLGYSWTPQSEVGDLLNQYGLKPLDRWLKAYQMESQILLQCHDSVVASCPIEEAWSVMKFLNDNLSMSREYGQVFGRSVELSMPCEFTMGLNWGKGMEWKALPTQEEVYIAYEQLMESVAA